MKQVYGEDNENEVQFVNKTNEESHCTILQQHDNDSWTNLSCDEDISGRNATVKYKFYSIK